MFSGIVEQTARLVAVKNRSKFFAYEFKAGKQLKKLQLGESVAINGVCLTVAKKKSAKHFTVHVIGETLRATNLGRLKKGQAVNVERSLKFGDAVCGHFVTGHVDGCGTLALIKQSKADCYYDVRVPKKFVPFMVLKGSVALDGISLTIQAVKKTLIRVSVIPHTLKVTNLPEKKVGDQINIEVDMLARYLSQALKSQRKSQKTASLSVAKLEMMGF